MASPLAGFSGKPILGKETSTARFVGGIIVELYEGPSIESDAHGLVMSIGAASGMDISQNELLKRIAAALPARIIINEKSNPPGYM